MSGQDNDIGWLVPHQVRHHSPSTKTNMIKHIVCTFDQFHVLK